MLKVSVYAFFDLFFISLLENSLVVTLPSCCFKLYYFSHAVGFIVAF